MIISRLNGIQKITKKYILKPLHNIDLSKMEVGCNCFCTKELIGELLEMSNEYESFALFNENDLIMTMIKTDMGYVSLPICGGTFNYFLDNIYKGEIEDLSFYYYGGSGGTGNPYFSKKIEDYSYITYVSRRTSHILASDFGMNLLSKQDYMNCALANINVYNWDVDNRGCAPNGFYVPDKKEWTLEGMFYRPVNLQYLADFGLQGFEHAYVRLLVKTINVEI